jgi:Bifunctional DNA primase/polymerase, N-terminal
VLANLTTLDNSQHDTNNNGSPDIIQDTLLALIHDYGSSPTFESPEEGTEYYNAWADFWRYVIGVNVIPANTRIKKTFITWQQYQNSPIPEEHHNGWKNKGSFNEGMAVVAGKVWHRSDMLDEYFVIIDADKANAIDELRTLNEKSIPLKELANKFLVEQHMDDQNKAHIYFYSPIPFASKSSDAIIGIEVKSLGEHGISYCCPSIHMNKNPEEKNEYRYEILGGPHDPATLTVEQAREMMQHINRICMKHGVEYLGKDDRISRLKPTIKKLVIDPSIRIPEGRRHLTLLSAADSLLLTHLCSGKTEEQLKAFFMRINDALCDPAPLPQHEIVSIWQSAVDFSRRIKPQGNGNDVTTMTEGLSESDEQDEELRLAAKVKLTSEDIAFVIDTMKKEAPYDEVSIKQLFYGYTSVFTKVPIPHNVNSKDAGAGKSYLLSHVAGYFPDKYVLPLTGMSDKAIFHRPGVLVIEKHNDETGEVEVEPIGPIINKLELEVEDLQEQIEKEKNATGTSTTSNKNLVKENKQRIKEIESEINDIKDHAEEINRS